MTAGAAALRAQTLATDLRDAFCAQGAIRVEPAILQSAETLLDLYGEDIRARAYVTADPARGELMLRPDFTVPVALDHMSRGPGQAQYTYAGPVFRRQESDPARASEYLQVGLEAFGDPDPVAADAQVFALFSDLLAPWALTPVTGDIGILSAAVAGLPLRPRQRVALMRHLWRPRRFRDLLDRFAGKTPPPPGRAALLAADDPFENAAPVIGLRSRREIEARLAALRAAAEEPPLDAGYLALIDAILAVRAPLSDAIERLSDIAVDLPALEPAVQRLSARRDALSARGIAADGLRFEASYGRTSMEYYDGFVFGFVTEDRPDLPPLASGGRYDALTERLSAGGAPVAAVGGVIRPDALVALEASS